MANFLLGGRLGDLIHSLWVVKNTPGSHDLFITDRRDMHSDGFLYPLERTYGELFPILTKQEWCNSFHIYHEETAPECINLSMWRRYAYSASWTQLLSNTFNVPVNGEPWITVPKVHGWDDKIVIHSSANKDRAGTGWPIVISMYEYRCVFVGHFKEYDVFPFKIPRYQPSSLAEHFSIINSCKFFIGNQSAPLAIAHSLGVARLAMVNEVDKIHYVGEEKFHKDFFWMAKDDSYFPALNFENVK